MDQRPAPGAAMVRNEISALMETNFDDLWRFARRRCPSSSDADDVTAEVFAVAWRRRDTLPPADERRLWLFGIARNVLANQRRSATRRERLHLRLVDQPKPFAADESERDPALWSALASLHRDDRDLLIMRAWDGLAVTDIAELLEISPNAVSLRLHKARTRLQTALNKISEQSETDPESTGHVRADSPTKEERHG